MTGGRVVFPSLIQALKLRVQHLVFALEDAKELEVVLEVRRVQNFFAGSNGTLDFAAAALHCWRHNAVAALIFV